MKYGAIMYIFLVDRPENRVFLPLKKAVIVKSEFFKTTNIMKMGPLEKKGEMVLYVEVFWS